MESGSQVQRRSNGGRDDGEMARLQMVCGRRLVTGWCGRPEMGIK